MKLNNLAAAIVAASFAAGANAAITDRPWTVPTADLMDVFVSGATAQDTGLATAYAAKCTAAGGQMIVFAQDSGTLAVPHASYSAYFCTEKMSYTGMSAPKYVLMHKRSSGGSAFGVGPVAGASSISRLTITDAACTPDAAIATSSSITAVATLVAGDGEQKCNSTTNAVPDIGLSDVEPALFNANSNLIDPNILENQAYFGGSVVAPGSAGTVPTNLASLAAPLATNSLTFGISVTKGLRDALQAQQGLPVGSDLEVNTPSLTRAQVASLFTGQVKTWSQFKNTAGVALDTFNGGPADGRVYVCRRSPGSGTQAQFNALFLNDGCAEGADSAARDNDEYIGFDDVVPNGRFDAGEGYVGSSRLSGFRTADDLFLAVTAPVEGPVVHENQGSGDVDDCMIKLESQDAWAVGVSSLERGNDAFRYVAIDGVTPTTRNVAANKYWDWAGSTLQYRSTLSASFSSDDRQFALGLAADTNTPAKLAAANTYNIRMYTTGTTPVDVGYLATVENGFTPNVPFSEATPTMSSGRYGNTCRTPRIPGNSIMLP